MRGFSYLCYLVSQSDGCQFLGFRSAVNDVFVFSIIWLRVIGLMVPDLSGGGGSLIFEGGNVKEEC